MLPKFSIIIPVYNVAPYLRECLDSVLAQTFTDWEAICVDDGSTDGSGAILDEYAAKDSRFRVIYQKNAGVSVARNEGLNLAQGEWVGFVDSDDVIVPDWLRMVFELSNRHEVQLIRLGAQRVKNIAAAVLPSKNNCAIKIIRGVDVVSWGWDALLEVGWSYLLFIRKDRLLGVRFPVGMRLREDNIFCLNVITRIDSVCQCGYLGYVYRDREGSVVNRSILASDVARFVTELEGILNGERRFLREAVDAMIYTVNWWRQSSVSNEDCASAKLVSQALKNAERNGLDFDSRLMRWDRLAMKVAIKTGVWTFYPAAVFAAKGNFCHFLVCLVDNGFGGLLKKVFGKIYLSGA